MLNTTFKAPSNILNLRVAFRWKRLSVNAVLRMVMERINVLSTRAFVNVWQPKFVVDIGHFRSFCQ